MSEKGGDTPHTSRVLLSDVSLARELLNRLILPAGMVLLAFLFGTVGFWLIGCGAWTPLECAYMTSITLTTVGYGEVLPQMGSGSKVFAMVLMWSGMGVTLYAVSTITAFLVETDLRKILKERRMEKRMAALKGHIIVCGCGRTAINVVKELDITNHSCVVIDDNKDNLQATQKHFERLYFLHGNATDEEILDRAGIVHASGIIAALPNDADNLLITVQARYVNPNIKIVARCNENSLADKFYRAGANYVVNPAFIGGMRMASQMIRPHAVTFLDRMLKGKDQSIRVEETVICQGSPWVGLSLGQADLRGNTGLLSIALKQPEEEEFIYNPSPSERLQAGTILIVIGNTDQLARLKQYCG